MSKFLFHLEDMKNRGVEFLTFLYFVIVNIIYRDVYIKAYSDKYKTIRQGTSDYSNINYLSALSDFLCRSRTDEETVINVINANVINAIVAN